MPSNMVGDSTEERWFSRAHVLSTGGLSIVMLAALSACIFRGDQDRDTTTNPSHMTPEFRQCLSNLNAQQIRYTPLPDQHFSGGCRATGAVQLRDFGTPTTNLSAMTCPLAQTYAAWVRYGVRPAARTALGSDVVRVETMGSYACRPISGTRTLSQHAFANAVDVSAFVLADGRRITVRDGWRGDNQTQQFLRLIHGSACRRFGTVLGPDYNAAHRDHLHVDMAPQASGRSYCR